MSSHHLDVIIVKFYPTKLGLFLWKGIDIFFFVVKDSECYNFLEKIL